MAESTSQLQTDGAEFFKRLTRTQKIMLGVVAVAVVAGIIFLVSVANQPGYAPMFTNLNPQDASRIVDQLKERKIPFRLEDGGKAILVPKDQVYELRLSFAGAGLPMNSIIGYEIFDRTNLGVSDFVQKINYRRALEGELARTILQLDEVEAARVHIVVPERALFKEDEKPATSSVFIKLKSNRGLPKNVISGIQHLVASSVPGLETQNVKILDSRGILLSDHTSQNSVAGLSSTQYEMQQNVENYLALKAQNLLSGVVGDGNAVVQVNAELDFRQVERQATLYDPDRTAIRSEQTSESKGEGADSSRVTSVSASSSTTTNYEVNKTEERIIEAVGGIKRLSVAAIINHNQKTVKSGTEEKIESTPRSADEIAQLTELVKKAVGFSIERNDQVSVVNLPFGGGAVMGPMVERPTFVLQWNDVLNKGLIILGLAGAIFILWSLVKKLRLQQEEPYPGEEYAMPALGTLAARAGITSTQLQPLREEISEEAKMKMERRNQIADFVKRKPDDAAKLLKVWLLE